MTTAAHRVRIFDTSLRDGEQAPGCTMTLGEKVEVARQLARLRVDIIEAGFPASSPGERDAVAAIAQAVGGSGGPVICGLARATTADIEICAAALAPAARRRIHTFIATSDIHLRHKLRLSRAEVLARASAAVTCARDLADDVEFSAEDAARSDHGFLCEVLAAAIEAGATTLNIPDTVGYATPPEYGALILRVVELAQRSRGIVVSVHCHNDLGLAVANSLAGVSAGARQVECTINGIGERAGNAALEEIVMALDTRSAHYGVGTGVDTRELMRTSRLVSSCTGVYVTPNKAVVGANAFAHEAGIHQDGVLKHPSTYEIMRPDAVGVDGSALVLGKHSGRRAVRRRLTDLGYDLDDEPFLAVFERFKELAGRKKTVDERDLLLLVTGTGVGAPDQRHVLEQVQVACGTHTIPTASVRLKCPDGAVRTGSATGDGPVDAVCRAVNAVLGELAELCAFAVHPASEGINAVGAVSIRVRDLVTDQVHLGRGVHTDIITAAAEAYVTAMNRVLDARAAHTGPVEVAVA